MASMTIRNIDDQLKARLRVQAAQHGRSMEDEARGEPLGLMTACITVDEEAAHACCWSGVFPLQAFGVCPLQAFAAASV